MVKRIAGALLWLFAVAWAFNFISAYTGLPEWIGGAVAAGVALFVGIDPYRLLWPAMARTDPAPSSSRASASAPVASRI